MTDKNQKRKLNQHENINIDTDSQEEINRKLVTTLNILVNELAENKKYVKELNEKFSSLNKSLDDIKKQLNELKSEVSDIEGRDDEAEGRIEDLEG